MKTLIDLIFTVTKPNPFLAIVGPCFIGSAAATVVITIAVRFGWRRGKGLEDL
jgi:hypothetical protein